MLFFCQIMSLYLEPLTNKEGGKMINNFIIHQRINYWWQKVRKKHTSTWWQLSCSPLIEAKSTYQILLYSYSLHQHTVQDKQFLCSCFLARKISGHIQANGEKTWEDGWLQSTDNRPSDLYSCHMIAVFIKIMTAEFEWSYSRHPRQLLIKQLTGVALDNDS